MINEFVNASHQYFDGLLESGTDDDLFVSGYLRGHLDAVAARCEDKRDMPAFYSHALASLQSAFDNNELNDNDQALVLSMWELLKDKHSAV